MTTPSRTARLAALALAALLAGCNSKPSGNGNAPGGNGGPTPSQSGPTIAGAPTFRIIVNNISPFWTGMSKGLDDAKASAHVNADWRAPSPAEHAQQVTLLGDAVAQKLNGVAISPIQADALAPTIDQTIQQGVPVITMDSDSPKSKRLVYLGTNNYMAGKTAGEETIKLFPNGAKLIAFVGTLGAQNARDRYQGFQDAVKGHNIEFVQEPFEDNGDKGRARSNVDDAITRYGEKVNGFVGLYSYNGPAIVSAVKAQNLRSKYKIICFDGEPETLDNLQHNLVDVTIVQKPYEFGRLSILFLNAYYKDKDVDKAIQEIRPELDRLHMRAQGHIIDTGVDVITPANAAPFIEDLHKKGLSST
jgi:ribose transport system substrate-binding protein